MLVLNGEEVFRRYLAYYVPAGRQVHLQRVGRHRVAFSSASFRPASASPDPITEIGGLLATVALSALIIELAVYEREPDFNPRLAALEGLALGLQLERGTFARLAPLLGDSTNYWIGRWAGFSVGWPAFQPKRPMTVSPVIWS